MTWLDRLEEETSVWLETSMWATTRDYDRHKAVPSRAAVSELRETIDGAISGVARAVTADALRQLDSQLGWRLPRPRGLPWGLR